MSISAPSESVQDGSAADMLPAIPSAVAAASVNEDANGAMGTSATCTDTAGSDMGRSVHVALPSGPATVSDDVLLVPAAVSDDVPLVPATATVSDATFSDDTLGTTGEDDRCPAAFSNTLSQTLYRPDSPLGGSSLASLTSWNIFMVVGPISSSRT